MIPDFKTYIGESIWNDIRKRGNGSETKVEDDVNHMDFDTFADYIEDNYSENGNWFAVRESEDGKSRHIEIDIIYRKEIDLTFNVVEGKIYNILVHGNKSYVDIPGLKQIFNVNIIGSSTFSVYEKNWTISNNTFVKLIEFFLDKKTTNESVWNDIRRRGNGTDVKQEDNINNFYLDEFYDYLNEIYETLPNHYEPAGTYLLKLNQFDCLSMMVLEDLNDIYRLKFENVSHDDKFVSFHLTSNLKKDKLYKILNDNYSIKNIVTINHGEEMYIYPKNGEINNSFFIELIDFILENVGSRLTKAIIKK